MRANDRRGRSAWARFAALFDVNLPHRAPRAAIGMLCAGLLALGAVAPAWADAPDPDFVYVPAPPPPSPIPQPPIPPPTSKFNGPCGLGVDSGGRFYVSDYYHRTVDVFTPPPPPYPTNTPPFYNDLQLDLGEIFPLDGPCHLALDSGDALYANNYHRDVTRFGASPSFGTGTLLDSDTPTGVAVDPATDDVYVDNRTHISVYDAGGNPVGSVGLGTLGDGYGVAVSGFGGGGGLASTAGFVYVADAADDTVKVYDPATDTVYPVATIDGGDTPNDEFVSLRDSAVAVDDASGEMYVIDNLQPDFTEEPQGIVYVFDAAGEYEGHLKYNVVHGEPSGLAVDNAGGADESVQGRVYVTSGNTDQAGVYAYPPGSAITSVPEPPTVPLGVTVAGTGAGEVLVAPAGVECSSSCEAQVRSGATATLTATPDEGSEFAGWSGDCSGSTASCEVTIGEGGSVGASFAASPASSDEAESPDPAPSSSASLDSSPTEAGEAATTAGSATAARRRAILRKRRAAARRRAIRRRAILRRRAVLRRCRTRRARTARRASPRLNRRCAALRRRARHRHRAPSEQRR